MTKTCARVSVVGREENERIKGTSEQFSGQIETARSDLEEKSLGTPDQRQLRKASS